MKTLFLTLAFVLSVAPAFSGEGAGCALDKTASQPALPDVAKSDIRKGDEPYVVVQWMFADEDAGQMGNAQHELEETRVD